MALRVIVLALVSSFSAPAVADLIDPKELARAFGHEGVLRREELTSAARNRNPQVLWSANFLSADEAIPVTTIVVAKGHTELTDAIKQKCVIASEQAIRLPNGQMMSSTATRLRLDDGAEGFSYLAGFGPGGTSYVAAVTTPDGKYDVAIAVGLRSDALRNRSSEQSSADPFAAGKSENMIGMLQSALRTVYPTIIGNISYQTVTPTAVPIKPFPALPSSPPSQSPPESTSSVETPSLDEKRFSGEWKAVVLIFLLLSTGALILFKGMRK